MLCGVMMQLALPMVVTLIRRVRRVVVGSRRTARIIAAIAVVRVAVRVVVVPRFLRVVMVPMDAVNPSQDCVDFAHVTRLPQLHGRVIMCTVTRRSRQGEAEQQRRRSHQEVPAPHRHDETRHRCISDHLWSQQSGVAPIRLTSIYSPIGPCVDGLWRGARQRFGEEAGGEANRKVSWIGSARLVRGPPVAPRCIPLACRTAGCVPSKWHSLLFQLFGRALRRGGKAFRRGVGGLP